MTHYYAALFAERSKNKAPSVPKERVVMVQKLLESGKRKARAPEGEAAAGGARHQLEDCEGDRADDSRELLFRADKVIE